MSKIYGFIKAQHLHQLILGVDEIGNKKDRLFRRLDIPNNYLAALIPPDCHSTPFDCRRIVTIASAIPAASAPIPLLPCH
jgi:hypothetical protein